MFQAGDTVGPYHIADKLGQGGMATVYKAHHVNLQRDVAIKVMHTAFKEDPNFLERFKREAQIVARLDHPHIIPIYDFADHQGSPYLVMKFVEGETLKARLKRGPLALDETIRIMDAVAQALAYAHGQGILHRDIKPSSTMLDRQGISYIADFGLARIAQAGESTLSQDMMLGTPQYISPEQAKGDYHLGPGTDIYSLGVVLYEIMVGRVPFNADTPYAIVHDHIYKALPLPTEVNSQVPPAVEHVLLRALAKEPDQRYESAADLIADFRRAVQDVGVTELSAAPAARHDAPPPGSTPVYYVGIPAPVAYTQHQTLTPQEAHRRRANLWILGGVGLLLLTCLASLFIIARAVSDPDSRPWSVSDTVDAAPDQGKPPKPQGTNPQTMTADEIRLWLEQAPGDPMGDFEQGMTQLEAGDTANALQNVFQAVDTLDVPPAVLGAIAHHMDTQQHAELAFLLYLEVLSSDDLSQAVREQAGKYLFTQTQENPERARLATSVYSTQRKDTLAAQMIHVLALLESDRTLYTRQAGNKLEEIDTPEEIAELYLVRGLYYLKIDQTELALDNLQSARALDDAPRWVIEAVEQLMNEQPAG